MKRDEKGSPLTNADAAPEPKIYTAFAEHKRHLRNLSKVAAGPDADADYCRPPRGWKPQPTTRLDKFKKNCTQFWRTLGGVWGLAFVLGVAAIWLVCLRAIVKENEPLAPLEDSGPSINCGTEVLFSSLFADAMFEFEDFPLSATTSEDVDPGSWDEGDETESQPALENPLGANFAGKYQVKTVAATGVGQRLVVKDLETNEEYEFPYSARLGYSYRLESRLLVVDPFGYIDALDDSDEQALCMAFYRGIQPYYFFWNGERFLPLNSAEQPPSPLDRATLVE